MNESNINIIETMLNILNPLLVNFSSKKNTILAIIDGTILEIITRMTV